MKTRTILLISILIAVPTLFPGCSKKVSFCPVLEKELLISSKDHIIKDSTLYHPVRLSEKGTILPWYSSNHGQSYDTIVKLVWRFWDKMELDSGGVKYYLLHQVWSPDHDKRGLGGDQFSMALSSWDLLNNFTGDRAVIENMRYIADYYLAHSISDSSCAWPNVPYPYNCNIHSGWYTGDMIIGEGYTQPDKAGSFGWELIKLYKKTGEQKYLDAAVKIANTLVSKNRLR